MKRKSTDETLRIALFDCEDNVSRDGRDMASCVTSLCAQYTDTLVTEKAF